MQRGHDHFDAFIIGGGPAGSTAALLLARAGWNVALVERKAFPRRKVCGEYLSPTNWPLFDRLGVADQFFALAGPPVRETAIYAQNQVVRAALPRPRDFDGCWGRALGRESLDGMLLDAAQAAGADIHQPCKCGTLRPIAGGFEALLERGDSHEPRQVQAKIVIAAHGSWDGGALPTQPVHHVSRSTDWLALKAHFRGASLPPGLMPLISFPGGYGGMVHCDDGRTSLSCCIRRGMLDRLPRAGGTPAGEAVLGHIMGTNDMVRQVLEGAALQGSWLAAGPIRPGIRRRYQDGIFVIGNAAGEAHPVVAEGISMAMQSAWLIAERLLPWRGYLHDKAALEAIGRDYSAAWRRAFATRIHAAAAIAHWAAQPRLVRAALPLLRIYPRLLTLGAEISGKAKLVAAHHRTKQTLVSIS